NRCSGLRVWHSNIRRQFSTRPERVWRIIAFLSLLLWTSSLLLPAAASLADPNQPIYGFDALVVGPMGILVGEPGWLANPLLWIGAMLLFRRIAPSRAILLTIAVILVALMASTAAWAGGLGLETIEALANRTFGLGYYLWAASIASMSITLVLRAVFKDDPASR